MVATRSSTRVATREPRNFSGYINRVLSTANFKFLQEVALRARMVQEGDAAKDITCAIDKTSYKCVPKELVLTITFSDNTNWIVRIPHLPVDAAKAPQHAVDMLSEIATIKTVKSRTTIPVPQVFAFDASSSNKFGFPYILMECLKGRVLDYRTPMVRQVPSEHLPHVARQLADVLYQLENLTFDRLGRIWCGEKCDEPPQIIPCKLPDKASARECPRTSTEWFNLLRQDADRQARETQTSCPDWRTARCILKEAVDHCIIQDRVHGPFPLCHLEFHRRNLLFDEQYNLTGVLDWSQAATTPLERLAVSMEYAKFYVHDREHNQVIVGFRDMIREHLQKLGEKAEQPSPPDKQTTTLSIIFGSRQADIAHCCIYGLPHRAIYDGRRACEILYGENQSWDRLVAVYGKEKPKKDPSWIESFRSARENEFNIRYSVSKGRDGRLIYRPEYD